MGVLTLDRPGKAHAYDRAHLDLLAAGLRALADCPVLVIRSTGDRAFCGGADLGAMEQAGPLDALDLRSQHVFTTLAGFPGVTVCAVQGPAVAGGCELALACDLRVVGPAATFSLPETSLGLVPSAGGCTRLSRLIGVSRTKAMVLGGEVVNAPTALSWGLANRLAEDPRAAALDWAREVAARDPAAQGLAKQVIDADVSTASLSRERVAEAILYARKRGT